MKQCTCYALRAIDCTCKPAKYGELYTSPTAKQEQGEPVAKVGYKTIGGNVGISTVIYEIYTAGRDPLQAGDLLYTTPQQRTWVGLTDDEVKKIAYNSIEVKVARAIEAKLKEKNT